MPKRCYYSKVVAFLHRKCKNLYFKMHSFVLIAIFLQVFTQKLLITNHWYVDFGLQNYLPKHIC